MATILLLYFSENQYDSTQSTALAQLRQILTVSNRNNKDAGLTGALIFDDLWFIQALEGERSKVWQTFKRIEEDERHANLVIVEAVEIETRTFGNWWMGFATRNASTASAFEPYLRQGLLRPDLMTAHGMLTLMISLAQIGLNRQLETA